MSDNKCIEDYSYDFFTDYQDTDGIYTNREDPIGSYGDPAAIEDINAEQGVAQMVVGGMGDPSPQFDVMAVLNAPTRVSEHEMVCLRGPCEHYVETVSGSAEGLTVTERFCTYTHTWAEPTKLNDVDVLACSKSHDPKSLYDVMIQNEKAKAATGKSLGICHEAGCVAYVVMILRGLDTDGTQKTTVVRLCERLQGASRMRQLDPYNPILGCTAVIPTTIGNDAVTRGNIAIEKNRAAHAARKGVEEDA